MNGKRGGKRFYRARIRRANADGTFDLDYDDGQKEKCVEEAMMREPEEEQRVEAQKWSCVTTYARQPLDRYQRTVMGNEYAKVAYLETAHIGRNSVIRTQPQRPWAERPPPPKHKRWPYETHPRRSMDRRQRSSRGDQFMRTALLRPMDYSAPHRSASSCQAEPKRTGSWFGQSGPNICSSPGTPVTTRVTEEPLRRSARNTVRLSQD